MIRVKQFYNPTEKDMNEFFETTKGNFISFNQSIASREYQAPDHRTVTDTVLIVNIVYSTNTGGGMS